MLLFDDSLPQSLTNDVVGEAFFVELFFKYFTKFLRNTSLSSRTVLIDLSMFNLASSKFDKNVFANWFNVM